MGGVPAASPIEAIATSTAAFVGIAPDADARRNELVACDGWAAFVAAFAAPGAGGAPRASTPLSHAVSGFFANGGRSCRVVNVGVGGSLAAGLRVLDVAADVPIVLAPGFSDVPSWNALLAHAERCGDRFAILDAPPDDALSDAARAGGGIPASLRPRPSSWGALYVPRLLVEDPLARPRPGQPPPRAYVSPAGHVAGVYARVDAARGVQKAPANELIAGALALERAYGQQEQEALGAAGIDVIRAFTGKGILLWGARTLDTAGGGCRYVSIRRLLIMLEQSIARGTRWAAGAAGDSARRLAARRDVEQFLLGVWRRGALLGTKPEQAFFVRCDDTTMTAADVAAGRLVILIGVAPLRPAEFETFRIVQAPDGN